jgi:predicted TIM-barrel fold metal-dependent hydrolase
MKTQIPLATIFAAICIIFTAGLTPIAGAAPSATSSKAIVDIHVHVAGLGYGDSGCFINGTMRENFRFPFYLWAMGVTEDQLAEHGDRLLFRQLSDRIAASDSVSHAVTLAMDGYVTDSGELDLIKTQIFVPNDYVAREVAQYDNLLFGASINPNRTDAVKRLRAAHAAGAVLVKWIPSIMNIDPANPKYKPFYRAMAELQIPLLSHTGMEKSFAGARDELADPHRLRLPLELGVTVIAAHIATTGESEGQDNFERILPMFAEHPNLYTDISSLTQINKLGYLARALKVEGLTERMIYGTDWPLQFSPLVSSWYHVNHIGVEKAREVSAIENLWDRDVALKSAFGVPDAVFERAGELLKIAPVKQPGPGVDSVISKKIQNSFKTRGQ